MYTMRKISKKIQRHPVNMEGLPWYIFTSAIRDPVTCVIIPSGHVIIYDEQMGVNNRASFIRKNWFWSKLESWKKSWRPIIFFLIEGGSCACNAHPQRKYHIQFFCRDDQETLWPRCFPQEKIWKSINTFHTSWCPRLKTPTPIPWIYKQQQAQVEGLYWYYEQNS